MLRERRLFLSILGISLVHFTVLFYVFSSLGDFNISDRNVILFSLLALILLIFSNVLWTKYYYFIIIYELLSLGIFLYVFISSMWVFYDKSIYLLILMILIISNVAYAMSLLVLNTKLKTIFYTSVTVLVFISILSILASFLMLSLYGPDFLLLFILTLFSIILAQLLIKIVPLFIYTTNNIIASSILMLIGVIFADLEPIIMLAYAISTTIIFAVSFIINLQSEVMAIILTNDYSKNKIKNREPIELKHLFGTNTIKDLQNMGRAYIKGLFSKIRCDVVIHENLADIILKIDYDYYDQKVNWISGTKSFTKRSLKSYLKVNEYELQIILMTHENDFLYDPFDKKIVYLGDDGKKIVQGDVDDYLLRHMEDYINISKIFLVYYLNAGGEASMKALKWIYDNLKRKNITWGFAISVIKYRKYPFLDDVVLEGLKSRNINKLKEKLIQIGMPSDLLD